MDFIYIYDHAHRLISEETQGEGDDAATTVEVIEFTYGEEETNPADYPVHAPSKIHPQTTASQTTTSTTNYTYCAAGTLRIGMVSGNATMFFVKDHLGSTNAIVTDDGQIVDTGEYMPYGLDRNDNDLLQTSSYKFTDQEQDDGTGLYNYNARLYDPVIGQFIMADTIVPNMFYSQSLNRYAYCLNNPVRYVDPTGHWSAEGAESAPGFSDSSSGGSSGGGFWSAIGSFFSGIGDALQEGYNSPGPNGSPSLRDTVEYGIANGHNVMTFSGLRQAENDLAKAITALRDSDYATTYITWSGKIVTKYGERYYDSHPAVQRGIRVHEARHVKQLTPYSKNGFWERGEIYTSTVYSKNIANWEIEAYTDQYDDLEKQYDLAVKEDDRALMGLINIEMSRCSSFKRSYEQMSKGKKDILMPTP